MTTPLEQIQQRHQKSLLNKKEVAEELNVSKSTIDRLRKTGALTSKKIGGGVFFTISDIALFLENNNEETK